MSRQHQASKEKQAIKNFLKWHNKGKKKIIKEEVSVNQ